MRTIGKLGLAAALLLGTAQLAMAGVVTETYSDPVSGYATTPYGVNPTGTGEGTSAGTLDGSKSISFLGFTAVCAADPTCAATSTGLKSVQFTLTENAEASGSGNQPGGTVTLAIFNIGSFALEGDLKGTDLVGGSSTVLLAADNTSGYDVNGGSSFSGPFNTGTQDFTSGAQNSNVFTSDLGDFLTGYSAWDGDTGSASVLCGGGNCTNVAFSDMGSITVTATYDYSTPQIPEPLGVAVMASGLMGLGFLRFRRSR